MADHGDRQRRSAAAAGTDLWALTAVIVASAMAFCSSARFSPDLTRVAFALAKRDPENEQGWVAVSDGLSGGSKLIVTGQPGEYFTIVGWLNADTLLLQSNQSTCNPTCTSSL